MTEEYEKLLALKDEELTKINKVKDMLKEQLTKTREENSALKEEIAKLKTSSGAQATSYPDLEDKIKSLEKELSESNNQIKELTQQNKSLTSELESTKTTAEKSGSDAGQEGPVSVEKLLNQVKNGMFKLGQQNFNLEQKIDSILEQIQSGNLAPTPMSATPTHGMSGVAIKAQTSGGPSRASAEESTPIRKPSDVNKSKEEEEVHIRKPSERLKGTKTDAEIARDQGEPARKVGLAAPKVQMKDEEPDGSDDSSSPKPTGSRALHSITYPSDGIVKCPECGAQSFQEMENRAKIVAFAPVKKYGKKYYCKTCRSEWDYDYV